MFASLIRRMKLPFIVAGLSAFMYVDLTETAFYMNNIYYNNTKYAEKGFWMKEYKDDASQYDWYVQYDVIAPFVKGFVKNEDQILQIGAGNSTLAENLYNDNYKHITNIDISADVVSEMSKHYKMSKIDIKYIEMDMLQLTFADAQFDIVLDKAGSDVLLVGKKPFKTYRKFMQEISRVLKKDGKFIFITLFSNFPFKSVIDNEIFEVLDFITKEKYSILILKKK